MYKSFLLPLCVCILHACGSLTQENTATSSLSYEDKNLKVESVEGCQPEQPCALFDVSYPLFNGLEAGVANTIQRDIEVILSMGDPEAEDKSLQQIADEFISNYKEFVAEVPEGNMGWYYSGKVQVNVLSDTLISLAVNLEYFTGGAHGGRETYFLNVDPKSGAQYKLANFLKPGYEKFLTETGERSFRRVRELPDTASYRNNSFEFTDDKFALNSNYGFTRDGLIFYYNNYEIGPYAAGPTEILIPYSEVKDWLKK